MMMKNAISILLHSSLACYVHSMDPFYVDNQHDSSIAFEPLQAMLAQLLQDGLARREHDIITWLQQHDVLRSDVLQDALTLFRCHFIIMHCLYRLQAQWLSEGSAWLEISALHIQRQPLDSKHQTHRRQVVHSDVNPLAQYYLDLTQLATTKEDVEELIFSFWRQMANKDYRQADLDLLQLPANANKNEIRQRYRLLAMQCHPDRGGDTEYFQQLTSAYQRLRNRT